MVNEGYRQSELGILPNDWEIIPICKLALDIADGPFGSNLKREHYTKEKEVRLIQLSNIGEDGWQESNVKYTTFEHAKEISRCIVNPGNIVIAKMMPAGRSIICPSREKGYVLSSDCVKVILDETKVLSVFFRYLTKSKYFLNQIQADTQGSTRARTSISKLKKNLMPIPCVDEQKAIASALSDIDSLIADVEILIAKKKNIKQGAMQDLLTGNKRLPGFTGEWTRINMAKTSQIKARIGWQGLTTAEYCDTGFSYLITGTDFVDGKVNWSGCHFVEKERFDQDTNIQVKNGDVLVTKDGTIGKVALVENLNRPATLNSGVFVIRPVSGKYIERFLYYVLSSSIFKKFIKELMAGSTITHLYQKDIVKFSFFIPPTLEEQEAIASAIYDIDKSIEVLNRKLSKYRNIKQGMMQNLLSGEIRLV